MRKLKLKRRPQGGEQPKEQKPKGLPPRALLLGLLGVGALALLLARPKPTPPPESPPPVVPPSPPTQPVVQVIPQGSAPQAPEPSPKPPAPASPTPAPAPSEPKPRPQNPFRLLEAQKPKEEPPSKPSLPLPPLPPPEGLPPLPAPPAPLQSEEPPKLIALTVPSPPGRPVAVLVWKGKRYTLALGEEVKGLGRLVRVETPCATLKGKKALKLCLEE